MKIELFEFSCFFYFFVTIRVPDLISLCKPGIKIELSSFLTEAWLGSLTCSSISSMISRWFLGLRILLIRCEFDLEFCCLRDNLDGTGRTSGSIISGSISLTASLLIIFAISITVAFLRFNFFFSDFSYFFLKYFCAFQYILQMLL